MALPKFKKKDDIPKGFEDLYEEQNGEFVPRELDEGAEAKAALVKLRQEKKDADKRAKEAEDKAADLSRQLDVEKTKGGDIDKRMGDALTKWKADTDAAVKIVQDQLDAANSKIRKMTVDDAARAAYLKAGGRANKADAALKLNGDRFDMVDDKLVVKDKQGQVSTVTIDNFWAKEFKADMPEFFEATKAAGGGGGGGAGAKPAASGGTWDGDAVLKDPMGALREANAAATE